MPLEVMVPAVAVKVAVVELVGTDTEAGAVSAALLDDRDTVVAVVRGAFDNVTVQVLLALDAKVVGEHCTDERLTAP